MQIIIIRNKKTPYGCDGRLIIDEEHVCDTTENPRCLLPAGTYSVVLKNVPKWGRKMPVITCPDITEEKANTHQQKVVIGYGNGLHNITDRRIHVGKRRVSGLVTDSFTTFLTLYNRINRCVRRGISIKLTIID